MAILNNNPLIGSGGQQGYSINNSLRFRSSASAYLNRTPASAGNRKTWTWSAWVKKAPIQGSANTLATLMGCTTGSTDSTYLRFGFYQDKFIVGNNSAFFLQSTPLYRDPSAWYHVVVSTDTTQGSASNRMRIYINGTEVTAWSTDQRSTYLTSSVDLAFNQASQHSIGSSLPNAGDYLDGYLADVNFIDGSAKTPSDFGETDTTTGVWKPKAYTGTYGTNGFYLKFSDIATTSGSNAGLGKDFSGNSNYWTTNNISVTSGTTYDAMTDSPTNTSATVANYPTLNPVDNPSSSNSLANANLTPSTAGASGWKGIRATMAFPTTGKWYYEVTLTSGTNNLFLGIVSSAATGVYHDHADTFAVRMSDCALRPSGATATGTQAGYAVGDVFGVAIDCSTPTVQFYKNGSLNVTYTSPTFDPSKTYFPCFLGNDTGASATHNFNFGQRPFTYTPPTGYVALNTYNLPTPTILQGNKYMDATLATGNNSTQVITNAAGFRPDFVWLKIRSGVENHIAYDSVRGAQQYLVPNLTLAEATLSSGLTSFNSNGFTLGNANPNYSGSPTFVAWQWQAGQGSTSSNTSGSITSTVSVNTTAGFSIVTYTGTGANATVGHGLGVAPKMIIVKWRSSAGGSWATWHSSFVTASNTDYLLLDSTLAKGGAGSQLFWNNTAPTSSVFSIGTNAGLNTNTGTYVAYCWAEIAGFSRFGSYVANASSDGPFIYTGFRPRWIMFKRITSATNWYVIDTSISPINASTAGLYPNTADAVSTEGAVDILSNGFKCRVSSGAFNFPSGETFAYVAFAENPFKNALAR